MAETHTAPAAKKFSGHPVLGGFFILLGLIVLGMLLLCTILQIETNEAFLNGGGPISLMPDWSVLAQPVQYLRGNLPPATVKAVIISWVVEMVNIVFSVGYEVACESVFKSNRAAIDWWRNAAKIILVFNAYTDYGFAPNQGGGFWEQVAFSIAVAVVVYFFGVIGVRFIEHGIHEW